MDKLAIAKFGGRNVNRALLVAQKYSPEALTIVGIAGVVTSAVLASRATLKLSDTLNTAQDRLDAVNENKDEKTDREHKRDLLLAYSKNVVDIVKLYGIPATVMGISIVMIGGGQGIQKRRTVGAIAGMQAAQKALDEYHKRVVAEYGEEKAADLKRGVTIVTEVDEETGKKTKKKVLDPNGVSQYAKFFDELNSNWEQVPEYNLNFLTMKQNYWNNMLQARGHVFLNEVYSDLGFDNTGAGALCGWVISKEGDNYIDFGIYDPTNEKAREFVNGYESAILLDFNVDGVIWDKI
jgi:uncharacterized protein YcfJ